MTRMPLCSDAWSQAYRIPQGAVCRGAVSQPNILEIGCGTGCLTEQLITHFPTSTMTAVDIAPAMIAAAEQRMQLINAHHQDAADQRKTRVHFLLADVEVWAATAAPSSFDVIVSNACFQWLRNPQDTLAGLRRLLRPGGVLAFTTFGSETFHELHEAFAAVYRANDMMPQRHGMSFPSRETWDRTLTASGFSPVAYEWLIHVEEHASVRDFLHAVKAVGASTSEASTSSGLGSRQLFTQMYKSYEQLFSTPGGVRATYEVHLFLAFHPEESPFPQD